MGADVEHNHLLAAKTRLAGHHGTRGGSGNAMRGNDRSEAPKPGWYCKTCMRPGGKERLVNYGYRTDCLGCRKPKRQCHDINVPLASPSTSTRRPPAPAPQGKDWQKEYEKVRKRRSTAEEQNRELKLEMGAKAAAALDGSDEPAPMDDEEVEMSIEARRELVAIYRKSGLPDEHPKVVEELRQIDVQARAKQAGKLGRVQLQNARRDLNKAEKRLTAHLGQMQGLEDDLAAAQRRLEDHKSKEGTLRADIEKWRKIHDAAALESMHTPPSPAADSSLQGILEAAMGANDTLSALAASSDPKTVQFIQVLKAAMDRRVAAAEQAAIELAAAEAATAAKTAATATTAAQPSNSTTATASETAAAAAPSGPGTHAKPPPTLHAPSPGPTGLDTPANTVLALFPDHYIGSSGEVSAGDLAVLDRLPQSVVLAHYGRSRGRSRSPRADPDI